MFTESKVTEIYCMADDFCKEFTSEQKNKESTSKCNITHNICKTPSLVWRSLIFSESSIDFSLYHLYFFICNSTYIRTFGGL